MDVRYINAFLESTKAVFDTMLKIPVTFDKPHSIREQRTHDVSGVIGLSGDIVGSVVVGFGKQSAMRIVTAFAGVGIEYGTPDFADAIGELTNMIAGGAKSKFEGCSVNIGCPTVITSPDHNIRSPSDATSICIPCNTPGGPFVIEVAFRSCKEAAAPGKADQNDTTAQTAAKSAA